MRQNNVCSILASDRNILPECLFSIFNFTCYTLVSHILWGKSENGKMHISNILKLCGSFFPCFKCLLIIFRTSGFFRNIFWGWWYILKINDPQCSHNTQVICICYFIFSKSKSIFFIPVFITSWYFENINLNFHEFF